MLGESNRKPAVLVYEDELLPFSQTFVLAQAESFKGFTPYYVGAHRVAGGLPLPEERTFVLNRGDFAGKVRERLFRLGRIAPGLIHQLRHLNPALVHAHFGPDGLSAAKLARTLDVPLVVTHHGYDVTMKPEFAVSFTHKRYLRQKHVLQNSAHMFLAVSQYIMQRLLAQGFPEENLRVLYVGVDTAIFRPSAEIEREPLVLFVGRLVENKGCEFLVRAMAKVRKQYPTARLVVIGDGPERQRVEAEAARSVPGCSFLGQQPQAIVRKWMGRASVFCVPCVTAKSGAAEAFGLVFIEAQAVGTPVVSFASGGTSEAIADGVTGFLSAEGDVDGLAASLLRLLREPELWRRFSEAGVQRVRSRFDLGTQSQELERLYRQLIAGYREQRIARLSAVGAARPVSVE